MNESLSAIDCQYYKNKYNLDLDEQSLDTTLFKIWIKKGYFPNMNSENYHYKRLNFHPIDHIRKYFLDDNNINDITSNEIADKTLGKIWIHKRIFLLRNVKN